jgi:hypothetical protein
VIAEYPIQPIASTPVLGGRRYWVEATRPLSPESLSVRERGQDEILAPPKRRREWLIRRFAHRSVAVLSRHLPDHSIILLPHPRFSHSDARDVVIAVADRRNGKHLLGLGVGYEADRKVFADTLRLFGTLQKIARPSSCVSSDLWRLWTMKAEEEASRPAPAMATECWLSSGCAGSQLTDVTMLYSIRT